MLIRIFIDNHYRTLDEISEELGTTKRTLYRDLEILRQVGFVIKRDGNKIVKMDKTSPYLQDISDSLYFSKEEAYLLKSAIESIDENTILKQNLKKKLYSVYDYKLIADVVVKPQDKANMHNLLNAIEQQKQVILKEYNSAHSNNSQDRLVEPFSFTTNFEQVWCYEIESQCVKTFKVARIGSVLITDKIWKHTEKHETGFVDIFRIHGGERIPIKLGLSVRAASLLKEEYPLSAEKMRKTAANKWILETDVCSLEGPARFILGLFDDIEIIDTPALQSFVQEKIAHMSKVMHVKNQKLK